jgi:hypothetical protein
MLESRWLLYIILKRGYQITQKNNNEAIAITVIKSYNMSRKGVHLIDMMPLTYEGKKLHTHTMNMKARAEKKTPPP